MKKNIKKKIKTSLTVFYLKIIDNSKLHQSNVKTSKHYKIIVSAYEFNNISLLQQHKKVYKIFFKDIPQKIYSIQLHTYSVTEWKKKRNQKFKSIPCIKKNYTYKYN
ncbi:BolA family protein [Buchnera aphidicola]|uniref:DNA-binding transcriptional regulator BolA n=1 Tax=Buchnera aphidicola (Cinara strobi) TaxID=1921549 RepID=A0A3B1DLA9_9GAMM|nr:BolA family protein [Buchnera aphidicola]VAX76738.1 DNA-binding transcriptional regulator BolA [Buchnera aphidicola (Cinara strobi)]